jgi:hypothetical protein
MTPVSEPVKTSPTPNNHTLLADDIDYDSADDSDFDPTSAISAAANANGSEAGSDLASFDEGEDDEEHPPPSPQQMSKKIPKKRKRTAYAIDYRDEHKVSDEDGGGGGLIKTRSQRAMESREKKLGGVARNDAVTTDVNKLWAEMNAEPVVLKQSSKVLGPNASENDSEGEGNRGHGEGWDHKNTKKTKLNEEGKATTTVSATGEKMITVKTTYEFAGKTTTEEKLVAASSETARIYLSSSSSVVASPAESGDDSTGCGTRPARRPPPKKRASVFDAAAAARSKQPAPVKINTLEKSRLDWAGFVDKEGIGDDLKKWNKGEKGYLDRQAFLGRVVENQDRQWKEGNKKI